MPNLTVDSSRAKNGCSGYEAVRAGLEAQTETTEGWVVDSGRLLVETAGDHAWFSDDVFMAWTDVERDRRNEFDTRWSGTLQRHADGADLGTPWRFVGMHVSTEGETA